MRPGMGSIDLGPGTALSVLFAGCSTGGVSATSCFALSPVVETSVGDDTKFFRALATSVFGSVDAGAEFDIAAVFGCGTASFCKATSVRLDWVDWAVTVGPGGDVAVLPVTTFPVGTALATSALLTTSAD